MARIYNYITQNTLDVITYVSMYECQLISVIQRGSVMIKGDLNRVMCFLTLDGRLNRVKTATVWKDAPSELHDDEKSPVYYIVYCTP